MNPNQVRGEENGSNSNTWWEGDTALVSKMGPRHDGNNGWHVGKRCLRQHWFSGYKMSELNFILRWSHTCSLFDDLTCLCAPQRLAQPLWQSVTSFTSLKNTVLRIMPSPAGVLHLNYTWRSDLCAEVETGDSPLVVWRSSITRKHKNILVSWDISIHEWMFVRYKLLWNSLEMIFKTCEITRVLQLQWLYHQ